MGVTRRGSASCWRSDKKLVMAGVWSISPAITRVDLEIAIRINVEPDAAISPGRQNVPLSPNAHDVHTVSRNTVLILRDGLCRVHDRLVRDDYRPRLAPIEHFRAITA